MAPIGSTRLKSLQKPFLLSCFRSGIRTDGRGLLDGRPIDFRFSFTDRGHAEVMLGCTKVLCCVSGEVVRPRPDQASEGQVTFNVDLSPMANSDFDIRPTVGSAAHERSAELSLMIESLLKKSRAVDTEALCIESGAKVWSLNVEIRVLDDDGNIKDAVALAALAGLLHFRRKKEVEYRGTNQDIKRLPPASLSIHHMPTLVTFCYVDEDGTFVLDPNRDEEAISTGQISIAVNQFRELCGIRKAGGLPITSDSLKYAVQIAAARAATAVEKLTACLKSHEDERKVRRKNIWKKYIAAEPVLVPFAPSEKKLGDKWAQPCHHQDGEMSNAAIISKGTARALKCKVKRKKRELMKQVETAKTLQQQKQEITENLSESFGPSGAPTSAEERKEQLETRVLTAETKEHLRAELNNETDLDSLFSLAVKQKKTKKKK